MDYSKLNEDMLELKSDIISDDDWQMDIEAFTGRGCDINYN